MILVDTSVWIDHFRARVPALENALVTDQVVTHPFVIGELACGNLHNRSEILGLLRELPRAPIATDDEVLAFIDRRKLMGTGLGFVDVHLLASTVLGHSLRIWTHDAKLGAAASMIKLRFS